MNKIVFGIVILILGLTMPVSCEVNSIQFSQQCSGYIKQAADANTPELALERLNHAIKYIEQHGLTNGYTSVFYRTEGDNVGYWYRNLKACQLELQKSLNKTQLEKTNVLMKVRESLTDNGENGTELTLPDGISRYPNNAVWMFFSWIGGIFIVVGFSILKYELD